MRKIIVLFLLSLFFFTASAQNFGIGASAIYNFQTESFGAGLRGNIFPNKRISIIPQASYYFSFNKVEEYFVGLGVECKIVKWRKLWLYGLAHGAYNSWLNYQRSAMKDAQQNNWNGEVGLGLTTTSCLRPFLEYRYNFKFYETHLQLGLLYVFGCKQRTKRAVDECPAYN